MKEWLPPGQRAVASVASRLLLTSVIVVAVILPRAKLSAGENWPQWRGPDGNGISDSRNLPTSWSLDQNIAWKTELPSWSGSTPVIWGDRVFLTSPSKSASDGQAQPQPQGNPPPPRGDGRGRRGPPGGGGPRGGFGGGVTDPGGQTLLVICLSKTDGTILWQRDLDQGNRMWNKGNNTSPSPVTDGNYVWVVTGTGVVTAFDLDGKQVWQRSLQKDYGKFGQNWGYGCSPLLIEGKLIIEVLHGMHTTDPSYLVAFDALTGKDLWRKERPTDALRESPDAYTTPALLVHDGRKQIVISGGDYVTGHDLDTGAEVWRAGGLNPRRASNYRIIASPVVKNGMIYAPSRQMPLLALRAGGSGDVTTSQLAWKWEQGGGPDVPTPVSDGNYFYMVDDRGLASCLDAITGTRIWGPEAAADGNVSASLLLGDGKLYVVSEQAVTTVLAAGPEFKVLAKNPLDGNYTLSSLAVSGQQLFLRSAARLYCIGKKSS